MAAEHETVRDWTDRALALCRETAGAGAYEVAYHALMSALHSAEILGDVPLLEAVAHLAAQQQEAIDGLGRIHPLSTSSAAGRGHVPVFHMAERQAMTRAKIARHHWQGNHPSPERP
jgi:hypothetical protein